MNGFAFALNDLFAITLLLFLFVSFSRRGERAFASPEAIFKGMLIVGIVLLTADFFTWILDGTQFNGAYVMNMTATVILYGLNPVLGFLYLLYCDRKMELPLKMFGGHVIIYSAVIVVNIVFAFAGIIKPTLFEIDSGNVYHRGPLLWLSLLFTYFPVLIAEVEVVVAWIKRRKNPNIKVYTSLLMYPLPAIFGCALQVLIPESTIILPCTAFSMLILFLRIQNAQIGYDELTGLSNRSRLSSFLPWKLKHINENSSVYCIMLDLDRFKTINDRFGHQVGNEALVTAARAMLSTCGKDDFVSRYGGDEFIIIAERASENEITELMRNLQENANRLTAQHRAPYTIEFSYGVSVGDENSYMEQLINRADREMYLNKAVRKESLCK